MFGSVADFSNFGETHDVNFCCRVVDLHSGRIKLTPFVPSSHAQEYFEISKNHPELYRYLSFGPFETISDFLEWQETRIQRSSTNILFAVIDKMQAPDKSTSGALAGIVGLLDMSLSDASTEIGFVITLPSFQGTHVTKNAIGVLLRYCLDLPEQGGLGLRRVQWKANAENVASIRIAEKLGFTKEGLLRWHWVLPPTKEGKKTREGDPLSGPGRHTVLLAICWDDWEQKQAALVEKLILS